MITAALSGALNDVEMETDAVFGLQIPTNCPGVDPGILNPRTTWDNAEAYDAKANILAERFAANFSRFEAGCSPEVRTAGPLLGARV
jgi:phosphoenolpyruvate carboxykinase (ATP)